MKLKACYDGLKGAPAIFWGCSQWLSSLTSRPKNWLSDKLHA